MLSGNSPFVFMAILTIVGSQTIDTGKIKTSLDIGRLRNSIKTTEGGRETEKEQQGSEPSGKQPDDSEIRREFERWMKRFKKDYKSKKEFNYRYEIFKKKYIAIFDFNQTKASYKKGINFFSDLLPEERLSFLGSIDREDEKAERDDEEEDFTKELEEEKKLAKKLRSIPLSKHLGDKHKFFNQMAHLKLTSVINHLFWRRNNFWRILRRFGRVCGFRDWHSSGHMTAVRNQSSCGSCWAFAAVGLVEAMYKIRRNRTLNLSEQELVDCDGSSNGCSGGSTWRALGYIRKQRIHRESNYPYVASDESCSWVKAFKFRIQWRRRTLRRRTRSFLRRLCRQPLHISYYVSDEFFDYSSGIYDGAGCAGQSGTNHAVVAVGHNINASTPFVKVKNSWGSWWGENGYFRMKLRSSLFTNGTCNMLWRRPSYVHV